MRWGSRARLKALLTIAACRDVGERVRSVCTYLSLISAPGHSVHQPMFLLFSPLFISHLFSVNVFLWTFCSFPVIFFRILRFTCSSTSKCSMQKIHLFLLSFLCFYSHFPLVFLVKEIWWQKTKHVTKINEWRHWWEWSAGSEKRGLFLLAFFFEHDRRSELMELNQTRRMLWLIIFRQGLAAVVCFFWQSDLYVTQTARGTPASESLSSSPYVLWLLWLDTRQSEWKRNSRAAPKRLTRRNSVTHAARRTPRRAPIPPPRRAFYRSSLGVGRDAGFTLYSEVSQARMLPSRRALCVTRHKQSGMTMPRSPPSDVGNGCSTSPMRKCTNAANKAFQML